MLIIQSQIVSTFLVKWLCSYYYENIFTIDFIVLSCITLLWLKTVSYLQSIAFKNTVAYAEKCELCKSIFGKQYFYEMTSLLTLRFGSLNCNVKLFHESTEKKQRNRCDNLTLSLDTVGVRGEGVVVKG